MPITPEEREVLNRARRILEREANLPDSVDTRNAQRAGMGVDMPRLSSYQENLRVNRAALEAAYQNPPPPVEPFRTREAPISRAPSVPPQDQSLLMRIAAVETESRPSKPRPRKEAKKPANVKTSVWDVLEED